MNRVKEILKSITPFEYCLWTCSVAAILLAFFLCGARNWANCVGSVIGVTALIFIAKGNVVGQFLIVIFSVFYGVVSYYNRYYGEMLTYLLMSAPAAIVAIVAWLRHPFQEKKTEVEVNSLRPVEFLYAALLSGAVTAAFYFLLRALNTANLAWSTVSVFTSFYASYLLIRRCPFYALAYAANDIVLIVLWSLASVTEPVNLCIVVCFSAFLFNDSYAFWNWRKMKKRQSRTAPPKAK